MTSGRRALLAIALLAVLSCTSDSTGKDTPVGKTVSGTVTWFTLEGGFYGIQGDDSEVYDPINLDPAFQQDGLRVAMTCIPRPDLASFHMVGVIVEIIDIKQI